MLLAMNARLTGPSINWDQLLKLARSSHSKQAWDQILEVWGERISHCSITRPLEDIYSLLKRDPQSLNYNPALWGCLLKGCLSTWNPQLGHEIHSFARRLHSPLVGIPAAQLYLESGRTDLARETATRTLRLKNLSPISNIQLTLIVAASHAEEGRREKAVRLLEEALKELDAHLIRGEVKADIFSNLGRIHFFLGDYSEAAGHYSSASVIYREAQNWEAAAKTIFNTAICHLSGDTPNRQEAATFMAQCRRLAEAEELPGPLAHCEASLGVDAYQRGAYSNARDHLRLALEYLPSRDSGYRRLRIVSTLAETYLAIGRIELATKFGQEALRIAEGDPGGRRHMRYLGLAAELKWEAGHIEDSQSLLSATYRDTSAHGITTIDEISALSRYYLQASMVSADLPVPKPQPKATLTHNKHFYLDYVYSLGELAFSAGDLRSARAYFQNCYSLGLEHDLTPHTASGLFGLIKLSLHEHRCSEAQARLVEFSQLISKLGSSPRRSQVAIIEAAIAYQSGYFEQSRKLLRQTQKLSRVNYADQLVLMAWQATLNGHAPRFQAPWQQTLLARYTRAFFAPYLERLDNRNFLVSGHYEVCLDRHPSLSDLLDYLLSKSNFSAPIGEIQTKVWGQSLSSQGWQQKIRNSIMRIRDLFPYTVAPLVIHSDQISLFSGAISLRPGKKPGSAPDNEIVRLLDDTPMSSSELAKRLELSPATTKRILKKLVSSQSIATFKDGRSVFYKLSRDHGCMPP